MGRLIIEQIVTVDGFASGLDGNLDFMDMATEFDSTDHDQLAMLEHVDAILLGRNTYTLFEDYWPGRTVEDDAVAEPINRLPKHVVSNTLSRAPWGRYDSATVENGEPRLTVARLKRHYSGDIVVWGSLMLCGALLQAELVDQVRLRIVPVLLGEGRTATPGLRHARTLRHVDTHTFDTGHITLVYDVL